MATNKKVAKKSARASAKSATTGGARSLTKKLGGVSALLPNAGIPGQVVVKATTPTAARRVFLGTSEFVFDANGIGVVVVPPGTYTLFWVVFGLNGQSYTIEVTAPQSAAFNSGTRTIVGNHDTAAHAPVVVL
jgi:hypothetical protein